MNKHSNYKILPFKAETFTSVLPDCNQQLKPQTKFSLPTSFVNSWTVKNGRQQRASMNGSAKNGFLTKKYVAYVCKFVSGFSHPLCLFHFFARFTWTYIVSFHHS